MKQHVLRLLENLRSGRNQNRDVGAVSPVPPGSLSMSPALGLKDRLVPKVEKGIHPIRTLEINVATLASVSPAGSSARNKFFPPEGEAAVSAASGKYADPGLIDEHASRLRFRH